MDPETWNSMQELDQAILAQLPIATATGDPAGAEAEKLVRMHRRWVGLHWGTDPERDAYLGLVRSYLADPRFVAYYDKPCGEGATEFPIKAAETTLEI